jgi:hypothetical protein
MVSPRFLRLRLTVFDAAYTDEFAEQGEAKGGLFLFALLIFLIVAYVFIIVFFASYTQYNGSTEDIPNNVRTSNLRPYFSAPPSHRQLLDWFSQRGFGMSVSLSGFTFAECQNLCSARSIESSGCFYSGTARPCSSQADLTCKLLGTDTCQLRWVLPDNIELTSSSLFKFFIGNAFLQELEVSLDMKGASGLRSNFSEVSQSLDTVELKEAFSSDKVQLPSSSVDEQILFGVERQYELNYVLLSSEKPGFSYQGLDWKMQAVFLPLQSNVITGTVSYSKYYCTSSLFAVIRRHTYPVPGAASSESNFISLRFVKPNYYVSNLEKRVKNGSEVFLVAILVTTAILDVFEVLGIIFKGIAALAGKFGKAICRKARRKRSTEEQELAGGDDEETVLSEKFNKLVLEKVEARLESRLQEIEKKMKKLSKAGEGANAADTKDIPSKKPKSKKNQ